MLRNLNMRMYIENISFLEIIPYDRSIVPRNGLTYIINYQLVIVISVNLVCNVPVFIAFMSG